MPARKSCWSRIMGERAVRAIESSTSISTEASVPATISRTMGSTGSGTGHHQAAEIVHPGGEAGLQREGRTELLDDRGTLDAVAGTQLGPVVDGGVGGLAAVGAGSGRHRRPRGGAAAGGRWVRAR